VTTLKKMPATRTKIKMITYPAARGRTCAACHAHTYAVYRSYSASERASERERERERGGERRERGRRERDRRVQGCRTVTAMFCNLN